ncbi:glycogen debranching enzyme [Dactylonectria macrodidyma]|uniref:Glycogen debranching enzyme n=1 Tax=Dactylonectria macrodidyma TaxID=307937 RepID=A0A9P9ICB4_9HYPO|nr:glycogen debranching enzyme [Dactylonectria macrodidyma]
MKFSVVTVTGAVLFGACVEASLCGQKHDTGRHHSCNLARSGSPSPPSDKCADEPLRFDLSDPPYINYFYTDCHSASQVVVTSPLPESNLALIGPRLLIAWPAGNSGIVSFFQPQNGLNGSLAISLVNSTTTGYTLDPIYEDDGDSENPVVGVTGHIKFNSSASLVVPIFGSIRTIRDFTEGASHLYPLIQDALEFSEVDGQGVSLSRLWLDNATTTTLSFAPAEDDASVTLRNRMVDFEAGTYMFNGSFNYPQLERLSPSELLNERSQDLVDQLPDWTKSMSFLSYRDKLLAGGWRFLTYFGRDSMISMLLMEAILSTGEGGAFEAGIAAVLERINKHDGSAAHEEGIGDFATFINLQRNIISSDPSYDYHMIDTDYFLPVLLRDYFVKNAEGRGRASEFMTTEASINPDNKGLTYHQLALINAEKIMNNTAAFAAPGGQIKANLVHLKDGELTGEWRDSIYGLGGGRIPYNVNTAIAPAALLAISALAEAGFFPEHPDWAKEAANAAQIWEDETLRFFEVTVEQDEARALLDDYVESNTFAFPSQSDGINSSVTFYGVALDADNGIDIVRVMNTDDCFRHFLLNTTDQEQLSGFLSQTADHILRPFPAGLTTDVGLLVANPAYGGAPAYSANFTSSSYHGTVVWSWQLSMMAAGLERQLGRCERGAESVPDFCADEALHSKVVAAYNRLWDVIDENRRNLGSEVWSWRYSDGRFNAVPLVDAQSTGETPTETNIVQYWSLTFLAVTRNESFR